VMVTKTTAYVGFLPMPYGPNSKLKGYFGQIPVGTGLIVLGNYGDYYYVEYNSPYGPVHVFWDSANTYLRPVPKITIEKDMGLFFANRVIGDRTHGARDFYGPEGQSIYAITDGYIRTYGEYWIGTWFFDVENDDGTWFRYAEIKGTIAGINANTSGIQENLNIRIKRGDPIGIIIDNSNDPPDSMLHLEWYQKKRKDGTNASTGNTGIYYFEDWSNRGANAVYDYVPIRDYCKRPDLLNPSPIYDLPQWEE